MNKFELKIGDLVKFHFDKANANNHASEVWAEDMILEIKADSFDFRGDLLMFKLEDLEKASEKTRKFVQEERKLLSPPSLTTCTNNIKYFTKLNIDMSVVKDENFLFVTEDGYPIFKGDSWHYVKINENGTCETNIKQTSNMKFYGNPKDKKPVKKFKYIENANDFIKLNKPFYSKSQVDKILSKG